MAGPVKTGRSYRVNGQLGQGAFGAVYLAETVGTGLSRQVAIKLLRPEKVNTPGLLGRLRDEARMLAAIRHRAIVRVDDLVELDGNWAIVMEYVEGCDVTELLKRAALPPVVALAVVEEIASALHAAYHQTENGNQLRLIHRDIKPSNLRITPQGEVKILDFGVARAEMKGREEATEDAAFGTVPYMAPERFYGEDSSAGDVYALGVTLFEMLTGVKPGKAAMDSDRVPPGDKFRAQWAWLLEVSQPLHDLIASMISANAADRPSARETARLAATIRASLPGESLDEWAERVVPAALSEQVARRGLATSDRTGTLLIERSGAVRPVPRAPKQGIATWVMAAPAALLVAIGVALTMVLPLVIWEVRKANHPPKSAPVVSAPAVPALAEAAEAAPPPEAAPATEPASGAPAAEPAGQRVVPAESAAEKSAAKPAAAGEKAATAEARAKAPAATPEAPAEPVDAASEGAAAEAPATEPAPPSGPGRVVLTGDATAVTLRGDAGSFSAGSVPPGTYAAEVTFGSGTTVAVRGVVVSPGETTTLKCSVSFGNCRVIRP